MLCMQKNESKIINFDAKAKKIENYVFKYEDLLGKGNFGSAYLGFDIFSGKQVAIKVIKMQSIKSEITRKLLDNQVTILRNLKQHPNILKCCNIFTSINNCYIITQLCERDLQKDLKKRGKFTEDDIKLIIYGVFKGLEELAKNNIIHRDIKVANIFLTKSGIPKIADFGFAINSSTIFKDVNIGSPLYMSPQGLLYREYSPKTDVWSFGVLIYELLFGVTPLQKCFTEKQLKRKILQPPNFPFEISSQLKQLINSCMIVDPFKRPNIFQLGELPYFKQILIQTPKKSVLMKSNSKISTECSISEPKIQKNEYFFKSVLSYQNGVSLMHYCRLLNKVNKKFIRSSILEQFLINLSSSLSEAEYSSIQADKQHLNKLKKIVLDYEIKYKESYEDMNIFLKPRQVLHEIQKLIRNTKSKNCLQALNFLDGETKVLIYALEHENPEIFRKNSEAKHLIDNGKLGI